MALSPRDAIAVNDIERYDSFMAEVADSQFLDMYLENAAVKIDVYEYPSNTLVQSAQFEASPKANSYFDQQKARADEILGEQAEEGGMIEREIICKRDDNVEEFAAIVVEMGAVPIVMPSEWDASGKSGVTELK
ncbi:hypothetical protein ACHAPU_007104 [Fusarium lateritium]